MSCSKTYGRILYIYIMVPGGASDVRQLVAWITLPASHSIYEVGGGVGLMLEIEDFGWRMDKHFTLTWSHIHVPTLSNPLYCSQRGQSQQFLFSYATLVFSPQNQQVTLEGNLGL